MVSCTDDFRTPEIMVQVRYFPDDLRAVTSHIAGRRAVVQKSRINCNVPKSCYHVFYSYRFLRRWAPCTRHLNFPAFRGCESILGRKSTDVIFSFHVLSCCNNSLSCRIRSLSCSFHVAFMSFQCPSKGDAQTGHMGILPNACIVCHILLSYLLPFWRPVQIADLQGS